jgi:hypothetical protein
MLTYELPVNDWGSLLPVRPLRSCRGGTFASELADAPEPAPRCHSDGAEGRYSNQQKVIKQVEITGTGIENYDSSSTGKDIVIKITYGNP